MYQLNNLIFCFIAIISLLIISFSLNVDLISLLVDSNIFIDQSFLYLLFLVILCIKLRFYDKKKFNIFSN